MLTEKGLGRFLNVKNAIAVAISTILILMTTSIEIGALVKADQYTGYLIMLFVMYLISLFTDYVPDMAKWYIDNFKTEPKLKG